MEGYNPFSALNKLKGFHFILFNVDLCLHVLSQIRKIVANTRFWGVHPDYYDITKGGSLKFITILQGGGVFPIYYNITRGRGGSLGTPNLYYVIYGRPLSEDFQKMVQRNSNFRSMRLRKAFFRFSPNHVSSLVTGHLSVQWPDKTAGQLPIYFMKC